MRALTTLCALVAATSAGAAAPFAPGNTLVQANDQVMEMTPDGAVVRTLSVPADGDNGPRDIVVDDLGRLHVYNGTFDPVLSTYDSVTETWSSQTTPGWSTANNVSYGGIATWRDFVFVTDMSTAGDGGVDQAEGFLRLDVSTSEWIRFAEDTGPIDLNVGLDDVLYVLWSSGRMLDRFDPATGLMIDSVNLTDILGFEQHRAVTADASGTIYLADWDGDVAVFDPDGTIIAETNICDVAQSCNLYDIDVASDGRVIIGDRDGGVTITNSTLTSFDSTSSFAGAFVSFVPQYNDDTDLVPNRLDTCTQISNPLQLDTDADGFGNACDTDLNNDCVTNAVDLGLLRAGFFGSDELLDFNSDGAVNVIDLGIMRTRFFALPGPSGLIDECVASD